MCAMRWFGLVGLSALLLLETTVRADSTTEARQHYLEGTKAYRLGEFSRAATEFRAAYEARANPDILFNLAQSYYQLHDRTQALFFYKSYLHELPKTPLRRKVTDRIATLQSELETDKAASTGTPAASPATTNVPAASAPSRSVIDAPLRSEVDLVGTPGAEEERPPSTPAYKKWWVWTLVGVVAVGGALGLGLGLGLRPNAPQTPLGTNNVF
jgi:hypothetical protein